MAEKERGPLEQELYESLRQFGLSRAEVLDAGLEGRDFTTDDIAKIAFQVQQNVHFADWTPLTAADVVFSSRRLVNLKGNPSFLLSGAEVSARGKYTVVIDMPTPVAQLPAVLASPAAGIVNSRLVRSHGGTDAADASTSDKAQSWFDSSASAGAGSGPYEIDSYVPGSQVVLRPNTTYRGSRRPGFGSVVIRKMAASAQFLNIRRGSHQIALAASFIPLIQPAQAFVTTTDLAGAIFSGAYGVDLTQISSK